MFSTAYFFSLLWRSIPKSDTRAVSQLGHFRQIFVDHRTDRRIAACRLGIRHQNDRLSVCWYLHSTELCRFTDDICAVEECQWRTIEKIPSGFTYAIAPVIGCKNEICCPLSIENVFQRGAACCSSITAPKSAPVMMSR